MGIRSVMQLITRATPVAVLAFFTSQPCAAQDAELLTLRVQDINARAGGQAALVLRTYQTRPVGQGTICFMIRNPNSLAPLVQSVRGVEIYSAANDVVESLSVREVGDALIVDVEFVSASAGVNASDGPMAAVFFDVSPAALPGTTLEMAVSLPDSVLLDENGQPVPIDMRAGELAVVDPTAPYSVESDAVVPDVAGDPITLSFETSEVFEIASGQVALRYSSRELPGTPALVLDPRFGRAKVKLDGYPGLAIMKIAAADETFNHLPGSVLSLQFDSRQVFSDEVLPSVRIDAALTELFDKHGRRIPLEVEGASTGQQRPSD